MRQGKQFRVLVRYALLSTWALLSAVFLFNAGFLVGNHFFGGRPDKISAEFTTSLDLATHSLFFSAAAGVLFYGLLRRVAWFFRAYWLVWSCVGVWLLSAISPAANDVPFLLAILAVLALPGLLLQRYPSCLALRPAA